MNNTNSQEPEFDQAALSIARRFYKKTPRLNRITHLMHFGTKTDPLRHRFLKRAVNSSQICTSGLPKRSNLS